MKYKTTIKIVISLILIILLIKFVNLKKLIDALLTLNIVYVIPIIIVSVFTFFFTALNLKALLGTVGKYVPFKKLVKYSMISWAIGMLSPGKIGDFSIVYFLKKSDIDPGIGFAITLIDKITTVLVLLLFTAITALIFLTLKEFLIIIGIGLIVVILSCLLLTKRVREFIKTKILKKYSEKFKGFHKSMMFIIKNRKKILLTNFLITTTKWTISGISTMLIFLAFGIKNNLVYITIISISLIILSLVPITLHGMGLREGIGIYLYGLINIHSEIVLAAYLILNAISYLLAFTAMIILTEELNEFKKTPDKNSIA